jgi:hypothetical protein
MSLAGVTVNENKPATTAARALANAQAQVNKGEELRRGAQEAAATPERPLGRGGLALTWGVRRLLGRPFVGRRAEPWRTTLAMSDLELVPVRYLAASRSYAQDPEFVSVAVHCQRVLLRSRART